MKKTIISLTVATLICASIKIGAKDLKDYLNIFNETGRTTYVTAKLKLNREYKGVKEEGHRKFVIKKGDKAKYSYSTSDGDYPIMSGNIIITWTYYDGGKYKKATLKLHAYSSMTQKPDLAVRVFDKGRWEYSNKYHSPVSWKFNIRRELPYPKENLETIENFEAYRDSFIK